MLCCGQSRIRMWHITIFYIRYGWRLLANLRIVRRIKETSHGSRYHPTKKSSLFYLFFHDCRQFKHMLIVRGGQPI